MSRDVFLTMQEDKSRTSSEGSSLLVGHGPTGRHNFFLLSPNMVDMLMHRSWSNQGSAKVNIRFKHNTSYKFTTAYKERGTI